MRIYHFNNMYMSQIQQGIQAAHCQMEMFLKYDRSKLSDEYPSSERKERACVGMLYSWAENHKTMICLNGGYDSNLKEIKKLFKKKSNPYPWTFFKESKEAMNGMLTNIAIVLPEEIYETAAKLRKKEYILSDKDVLDVENNLIMKLSNFQIKLIEVLNSHSLA